MINELKFNEIKNAYKASFITHAFVDEELYKWKMLKCFKDNWDITAANFLEMVKKAFKQTGNLLASSGYTPFDMICKFIKADESAARKMFEDLYDESVDLNTRILKFKESAELIMQSGNLSGKIRQDERAITTYLWLRYPDRYYIYKSTVAEKTNEEIEAGYTFNGNKVTEAYAMYGEINALLKQDGELKELLESTLTPDCYPDPEFVTLTIDFCFYIQNYYYQEKNGTDDDITAKKREKKFKSWALYQGKTEGKQESTIKSYFKFLKRLWKRPEVTRERNSPYEYGYKDAEEFEKLYQSFESGSCFKDADYRGGYKLYLDFLKNRGKLHADTAEEKNVMTEQPIKKQPKNIILYGPPGTGKTRMAILRAMQIIAPEKNYTNETYDEAKAEYDKLSGDRVQFVTFHQSYGYEEFIEGIKPVTTDDDQIIYKTESGVFKKLCKRAEAPIIKGAENARENFGLNADPAVWKVSLQGAGENDTRRDCLDNDHIRIGFDEYGEEITDETVFDPAIGGKVVLNAFINKMRAGDIVLSCYNSTTIDAIGVVTGGYEWHDEYKKFKRLRKVRWLVKDISEDIKKLNNNVPLVQASVYKLNIAVSDVLSLAEKYDPSVKTEQNDLPYVLIIDEINRGNISKIFGELITLIESSRRKGEKEQTKAVLPYSNEEFSVPSNVYIIGTMNTADRSVTAIDAALRRRFRFEEIPPDTDILKNIIITENGENTDINVALMLETINKRVEILYDREHVIGHSYFLSLKPAADITALAGIFKTEIIPLLQEYFYDDYEKIRLALGDNQKGSEDLQFIISKKIAAETLFGNSAEMELDAEYAYSINPQALTNPSAYVGIYAAVKTAE